MKVRARLLTCFVAWLGSASAADRPNVLLLCIDDLRPELACFGVDHMRTPNIDALATTGRAFWRHYVQAPTCGASRYALLTGRYGFRGNSALLERAKRWKEDASAVTPSLPAWFRQHGYTTVSVGKVSHFPGGRGGPDWDSASELELPNSWDRHLMPTGRWQHPRGAMHGLAHGEIRHKAADMNVLQSAPGPDSIYPDGLITQEALGQLEQLGKPQDGPPFFLAVGLIRPHLPFGAPAMYMAPYRDAEFPPTPHPEKPRGKTTWHRSSEFMKYQRWKKNPTRDAGFALLLRKHYAACVSYADAMVGKILVRLEEIGRRDDTIVLLWGDHGWHLGEHGVWGKHTLFEESLRSPLIVSYPGLARPGEATRAVVETIDLFPTLCDLAGLPKPAFLQGSSLVSILENPESPGHTAVAYKGEMSTIRTNTHRLVAHPDGHLELYDHRTPEAETRNRAASEPEIAKDLLEHLRKRLP
jgi:iduronate 2-sulfatase